MTSRAARGQATVELVLVLPLLVTLLLAIVQVATVARTHVLVADAARDAARAAAVDGSEHAARVAALDGSGLDPARVDVSVDFDPQYARVTVTYRDPTSVPLVGALVGDVTVSASVTMRRER